MVLFILLENKTLERKQGIWGEGEEKRVVNSEFKPYLSSIVFLTTKPIAKAKEVCNQVIYYMSYS